MVIKINFEKSISENAIFNFLGISRDRLESLRKIYFQSLAEIESSDKLAFERLKELLKEDRRNLETIIHSQDKVLEIMITETKTRNAIRTYSIEYSVKLFHNQNLKIIL